MNKLRITLNEDGSVVQFAPDFKIIRGSYYDVLINIEVPHSLLVDPVTDTGDGSGATGNNVRVGGLISTANGRILQTKRYEFQYVKDFERAGISYKLYQRKMPKEFTMWETVCENETGENGSLKLVINVVNWTLNDLEAKVEEVSASPAFYLDIYPSEYLTEEEEIESPSDFATLQSQVQDIATDFTTLKTDLYTESGEGLGDYLKTRLAEGNKIVLTETDNQIEIAVDTLYASDIVLSTVDDLDADNLQTALEEISRRFDSKSVDTLTGEDEGLVDNADPNNPVILHDATKVDVTTFDEAVEGLNSAISTNAEGISTINTNLASYSLINATGAKIDLSIDTTNYIMTLALKNATGETLSTQTIDFPLESMVVGASYKKGTLTLTLQNGTTLDIDISSIIDGLVSQSDFDDLSAQVEANTGNIASNATNISTNTANIATNTADIATNKANIATNTANISTNTADISTNASAIATETTERTTADAALQSNIDAEAETRATADTTLQGNIDSEASARTSADSTLQTNIDNEASRRATADSTLQTNIDNLELASGASLALSIDNSTYVMTLKLLNSEGTVLSTGTVDLPLETMVVSASYLDGKLYLTLQNGTTLEGIDISSIISGLVSQTDFDTLSTQVNTNTANIATNTDDISALKTQVATNTSDITSLTEGISLTELQAQVDTNTTNISTNTSDISANATAISTETSERESADSDLQSQITANTTAISTETSNRTSADSTLQTNIDNLRLASGATLSLSIDETSYVMTIQLKNSAGTTLSTGTVDLPLETMVVSGTYSDGKLYLTLKNGTQLDPIDISDIVSGLVSQTDFDTLKVQVETNTSDIATKATIMVDTAENWESNDPVLAEKEFGYDSTNNLLKIGNGTDSWDDLPYYVPTTKKPLNACSWDEINTISATGVAELYFSIGDEKVVELSTGEQITLVILGFNHDVKTAGGKAGITFGMKHSLATTYYMNSSGTNSGGWDSSYMRGTVMPLYLSYLPEDLQAVIKPVNKLASAGSSSSTITTSSDSLFLLSHIEVMGTRYYSSSNSLSYDGEGSQYEYFKKAPIPASTSGTGSFTILTDEKGTFYTSSTSVASGYKNAYGESKSTSANYYYNFNNARAVGASSTTANIWWLRSPFYGYSTYFCYVYSYGYCSYSSAISSFGVAFGFCI